jgi:rare lipoprotein A (peptidoglycan hydrolase)
MVNLATKLLVVGGLASCLAVGVAAMESGAGATVGPTVCTVPHEDIAAAAGRAVPGKPDLSGHTRLGKASFYAHTFYHRLMADGRKMDPLGDNAASRTLPLGTTARIINTRTGQSAVVAIEDRGPYVRGRIVDLSPATARKIGLTRRMGVAEVKVAPISVQLPDGSLKAGSGWRKAICRVYKS